MALTLVQQPLIGYGFVHHKPDPLPQPQLIPKEGQLWNHKFFSVHISTQPLASLLASYPKQQQSQSTYMMMMRLQLTCCWVGDSICSPTWERERMKISSHSISMGKACTCLYQPAKGLLDEGGHELVPQIPGLQSRLYHQPSLLAGCLVVLEGWRKGNMPPHYYPFLEATIA